jgi:hypothetical protein
MTGHDDLAMVMWLEASYRAAMKKRTLAAFLWFYAGWYAGAVIANQLGLATMLGPVIGLAAAALFVGDPRRIIWKSTKRTPMDLNSIRA